MKRFFRFKYFILIFAFNSCIINSVKEEIVYSSENGIERRREFFDGSCIVKSEGYFKKNKPVDLLRKYYDNGLIFTEEMYDENSLITGIVRKYYPLDSGSNFLNYSGSLIEGKPFWWWRFYYPNGVMYLLVKYNEKSQVEYFARFDIDGIFIKDSTGLFPNDTSLLH